MKRYFLQPHIIIGILVLFLGLDLIADYDSSKYKPTDVSTISDPYSRFLASEENIKKQNLHDWHIIKISGWLLFAVLMVIIGIRRVSSGKEHPADGKRETRSDTRFI